MLSSEMRTKLIACRYETNGHDGLSKEQANEEELNCAALATGMKCLPKSKVSLANGNVLHDSHAEVLAIRAFNRFLVDECAELARRGFRSKSQWVRWREQAHCSSGRSEFKNDSTNVSALSKQPFELHDNVRIHMFCSECPCGDASMENIMAAQDDATPWDEAPPLECDLQGRGHFDQLGIVRRKPARADAPVTLSKSCSDKLALKQVTGLLSTIASKLIWPANVYLASLVLPEGQVVPRAVERAWSADGRLRHVIDIDHGTKKAWLEAGYSFHPFSVQATSRNFEFSKTMEPNTDKIQNNSAVPSNLSVVHTANASEILINGVLQGRRQLDPSGASCVSRRKMWSSAVEIVQTIQSIAAQEGPQGIDRNLTDLVDDISRGTYAEVKAKSKTRQEVKRFVQEVSLKGWKRNDGDDDFSRAKYDSTPNSQIESF